MLPYPHLTVEANLKLISKKRKKINKRLKRGRPALPEQRFWKTLPKGHHVILQDPEQPSAARVKNTNNTKFIAVPVEIYREKVKKYYDKLNKQKAKGGMMGWLMKIIYKILNTVGVKLG